ncbi:hypothetical protein H6P81_009496 [Aristolochia fimbriata]|uniref:BHLH domain-containing protein n=1 Tax=Aristolochia fimbriata TaxID=158543 RepID=A0AAV7ENR1_ARIFI|nr:hypothetical protein H6P81_009496 [Aristolochia fimbriata]
MENHAVLNNFGFPDWSSDYNMEKVVEYLRGEGININEGVVQLPSVYDIQRYEDDLFMKFDNGGFGESNRIMETVPAEEMLMGFNPSAEINVPPPVPGNIHVLAEVSPATFVTSMGNADERDEEINECEEDSSGATTPIGKSGTNADRSRTLVAERRRRGRMKEKLYALRSLVPNITKMDKASIVGDAVEYVKDLQKHAKKLRAEIDGLELYSREGNNAMLSLQGNFHLNKSGKNDQTKPINPMGCCKITQMEAFQVEERGFYVKIVSSKGEGAAIGLYRALESLTYFVVQSSNFNTLPDRFVLTFTINANDCGEEINVSTLKFWLMSALLNQGFSFQIQNA